MIYIVIILPGIDSPFFFPFRKPKRIRTAFSPSQLLKLEQIFEKNHYVVGQERKELAISLNLTETQVSNYVINTNIYMITNKFGLYRCSISLGF